MTGMIVDVTQSTSKQVYMAMQWITNSLVDMIIRVFMSLLAMAGCVYISDRALHTTIDIFPFVHYSPAMVSLACEVLWDFWISSSYHLASSTPHCSKTVLANPEAMRGAYSSLFQRITTHT